LHFDNTTLGLWQKALKTTIGKPSKIKTTSFKKFTVQN